MTDAYDAGQRKKLVEISVVEKLPLRVGFRLASAPRTRRPPRSACFASSARMPSG
jgi:hypothetical protein